MTDTRDTPEAALAAAWHEGVCGCPDEKCGLRLASVEVSAAILAAMPNWRLVPADTSLAYDTGFQDGLLASAEVHRDAVPVDAERLADAMWTTYGSETTHPAMVKSTLRDWSIRIVAALAPAPSEPLDLDGLPFCPSGYAQRYHALNQCNCTPEAVEEP